MKRRFPLAPAEGWLTLGLVLLVCLTMAWTIDDGGWVLGRAEYLDLLALTAIGGVLAGFIGAKVGWGRWLTYLIGSIFAALVVPLLTGLVKFPGGASLHDLYETTAASVVTAYFDIAIRNLSATPEYLHYIVSLGILVWATSMFASFAVFGHRRPLNGVIIVGVILVGSMALNENDQLPYLVLYTVASLLLLIRTHVFDEQSEWLRRRIGEPASVSSVYLRGGTVFIAAAVAASVLLTQTAASAPLAGAWGGVEDGLLSISRSVSRFLPTGGSTRSIGLTFGSSTQVGQVWSPAEGLAVTIQRNPADKGDYYWRAWTYDKFDLRGWTQSRSTTVTRPAGSSILEKLADDVLAQGMDSLTFTVTPAAFRQPTILSPQTPVRAEEDVRLTYVGEGGYFSTLDRANGNMPYTITALVPVWGNDPGQLNKAALRATSTDYPDEIRSLYLAPLADGMLGPEARKLEDKIRTTALSSAPVDLAVRMVEELHDPTIYRYETDIRDADCASLSLAECFATFKKGYCQYYAATMAVILRDMGVPTRIAEGFLPGTRDPITGIELLQASSAHAWVEVYFEGFGWVPFNPTGGDVVQLAPLPSGRPVGSTGPRSSASAGPRASLIDRREGVDGPSGSIDGRVRGSAGPLIAVGLLLLLCVSVVAFLLWRRGPRGTSPDGAYGMVTRLASRLGFAPRPTQTVYEFAGSLGEILPGSRPELETVARAKVESAYGRAILGDDRLAGLLAAQRHLRVSLLRLIVRRRKRPRRPRR